MISLTLALLWLITANLTAMLPTRDHHWRAAYVLVALGFPLAIRLCQTDGVIWTLAFLLAAASILRWPVWFLWKWVRGLIARANQ